MFLERYVKEIWYVLNLFILNNLCKFEEILDENEKTDFLKQAPNLFTSF